MTGTELHSLRGHTDLVNAVAIDPYWEIYRISW